MQRRERKGVFINGSVLAERKAVLQQLQRKRDALLSQLEGLLEQRAVSKEKELHKKIIDDGIDAQTARALAARKALRKAKEECERLKAAAAARRTHVERASTQLATTRQDVLAHHFPTLLRYQSLTLSHVGAMLLREQRLKVKQLMDVLPLRVTGLSSGPAGASGAGSGGTTSKPAGAIQIAICGLKLPESINTPANGWQQPEAVSAALGYLLLFLDLISAYMGGPLLHEGSFQGSTSVVWAQHSFWNRKPAGSNAVLPLFLEEGGAGGVGGHLMPNPFASKVKGAGWAALPLTRPSAPAPATPERGGRSDRGTASSGPVSLIESALARQRNADQKLAFEMLLRSVSCFVRDKSPDFSLQLPAAWGPCGWLMMLCSVLNKQGDARTEGVIAAASGYTSSEGGAAGGTAAPLAADQAAAGAAAGGGGSAAAGAAAGSSGGSAAAAYQLPDSDDQQQQASYLLSLAAQAQQQQQGGGADFGGYGDEGEGEEVDADGWDVVRAPYLPPPPSEPGDVEQWSRAMFTDAQKGSGASSSQHQHYSHSHSHSHSHNHLGGSGGSGGAAASSGAQGAVAGSFARLSSLLMRGGGS